MTAESNMSGKRGEAMAGLIPIVPVIGGGPAGMSCALWLHNYALRPVIIETEQALGGMARRSPYPNEGLLGRPHETARENAKAFAQHIRQLSIETWLGARPARVQRGTSGGFQLEVNSNETQAAQLVSAAAMVIATGTTFRGAEWLDRVPNAMRMAKDGRVHVGAPWAGEPHAGAGAHVAVIGGGDNAFDVARMLAERGVQVTVVMRSKTARALPLMVERLHRYESSGLARVIPGRTVEALEYSGSRIRLRLDGDEHFESDHVVVLFGYRPNTDESWIAQLALERDSRSYVLVDGNMETSSPGVFAVGDVANQRHPSIATALGSGTMAARAIAKRLYASEGPA
jgi:thioredoxin reductase